MTLPADEKLSHRIGSGPKKRRFVRMQAVLKADVAEKFVRCAGGIGLWCVKYPDTNDNWRKGLVCRRRF